MQKCKIKNNLVRSQAVTWHFLPRLDSPQVQNWKVWWWNESLRKWWLGLTKTAASFGLVEVYLQDIKGRENYILFQLKYKIDKGKFMGMGNFEIYNPPPPPPPPQKKGTSLGLDRPAKLKVIWPNFTEVDQI